MVAMISPDPEAQRLGFLIREPNMVALVAVPFFHLFCRGLERALDEGRLIETAT